jgi:hypothetical protein
MYTVTILISWYPLSLLDQSFFQRALLRAGSNTKRRGPPPTPDHRLDEAVERLTQFYKLPDFANTSTLRQQLARQMAKDTKRHIKGGLFKRTQNYILRTL